MKKEYITPELYINEFDTEDVITASITDEGIVELPAAPIIR